MKKLILIIVTIFGFLSCENPSVEDGLASLEESLAELQAAMAGVDVDQMLTDVSSMQTQVETMQIDIDAYNEEAGVINGLDQCPETILGATVNNSGCSVAQLEAIASGTASSTTTSSTTTSSTTGG